MSSEIESIASSFEQVTPRNENNTSATISTTQSELSRRAFLTAKSVDEDDGNRDLLQLKATSNGTSLILSPLNATDSLMLANYLSGHYKFTIEVEIHNLVVSPVQVRTKGTPAVTLSHQVHAPLPESAPPVHCLPKVRDEFGLRHIYSTSSSTYRVQLCKSSKHSVSKKFSRNARNLMDALWICEFALIMIDQYSSVDDLIDHGNYRVLLTKGWVSSVDDYITQLPYRFEELRSKGLMRTEEVRVVNTVMQGMVRRDGNAPFAEVKPSTLLSEASPPVEPTSFIKKAKGSLSQVFGGLGWSSKKRRRVPKSQSSRAQQHSSSGDIPDNSAPMDRSPAPPVTNTPSTHLQLTPDQLLASSAYRHQYDVHGQPLEAAHYALYPSFSSFNHQVTSGRGAAPLWTMPILTEDNTHPMARKQTPKPIEHQG